MNCRTRQVWGWPSHSFFKNLKWKMRSFWINNKRKRAAIKINPCSISLVTSEWAEIPPCCINPNLSEQNNLSSNIIWPQSGKRGNSKQIIKSESVVEGGKVFIGELLLDPSGISSSSNLRELTLREQSPIHAPAATCKSWSGQHLKSIQPPPLQNYSRQ